MSIAELKISLRRQGATSGCYVVTLRYRPADSEAPARAVEGTAYLEPGELGRVREHEYGRILGQCLLAEDRLRDYFTEVLRVALSGADTLLRVRLWIAPDAPELHAIRWEAMRIPGRDLTLAMVERVAFSRHLDSDDWRPVRLRPRDELRALVAIAAPADVTCYEPDGRPLAAIDVAAERERARIGLDELYASRDVVTGANTIDQLRDRLRDDYDIVYLVCHGALVGEEGRQQPHLWLEGPEGRTAVTDGGQLISLMAGLQRPPRLVVLASCQGAGRGDEARTDDRGVLAALGPQLAEAGIPAVVAMHGNIFMKTVGVFMPVFFRELRRDGRIDRAMAAARLAARSQVDVLAPCLFTRLRDGVIWGGFRADDGLRSYQTWDTLLNRVAEKRCTPILGPGVVEALIGTTRRMARRWAQTNDYPLAEHARDEICQVAQYLATRPDTRFPYDQLVQSQREAILDRHRDDLPEELRQAKVARLTELIAQVGRLQRQRDRYEPHRVLAGMPYRIYLTANPDNLLAEALKEAGKDPVVRICPWNDRIASDESAYLYEDDPDESRPLVYHLFGRIDDVESLVLTVDDYFDYLIGSTRNRDLIPEPVRAAQSDSMLLFLGFSMDHWNFRALVRSLSQDVEADAPKHPGRRRIPRRRTSYSHVGAQLDPEDGRFDNPRGAREFLEKTFRIREGAVNIYWGGVRDFIRELADRWDRQAGKRGSG
jgi:hypothetical protein